jgi:hypothetical protein
MIVIVIVIVIVSKVLRKRFFSYVSKVTNDHFFPNVFFY